MRGNQVADGGPVVHCHHLEERDHASHQGAKVQLDLLLVFAPLRCMVAHYGRGDNGRDADLRDKEYGDPNHGLHRGEEALGQQVQVFHMPHKAEGQEHTNKAEGAEDGDHVLLPHSEVRHDPHDDSLYYTEKDNDEIEHIPPPVVTVNEVEPLEPKPDGKLKGEEQEKEVLQRAPHLPALRRWRVYVSSHRQSVPCNRTRDQDCPRARF
mmetsp:Transcript_11091/g.26053  ORF Transcript_11091/g.26053 Transcript_11091/m.26053 type:complete len:209 (+) Transcript_11091:688-1314(+)